jgi:hypothetical protein
MSAWWWVVFGLAVVCLVPTLWLLDRLGLWLEERGWLYYRKKKSSSSPLSSLVALQQLVEPGVEHVIHVGQQRRAEDADDEAKERLLSCLRGALRTTPVNPEAIRLYLTQARREGLRWELLYEEASEGLPADLLPPPRDVAPPD